MIGGPSVVAVTWSPKKHEKISEKLERCLVNFIQIFKQGLAYVQERIEIGMSHVFWNSLYLKVKKDMFK